MDAGLIERVETGAERGASALFAAAVGYAAYGLSAATGMDRQLALGAAGAGALAYLPCSRLLRFGKTGAQFALPDFELADFEFAEPPEELLLTERWVPEELVLTEKLDPDELLLTAGDRLDAARQTDQSPFVLDDILAELGPDARVVRLFDRETMRKAIPTPGELQSRIADHLGDGAPSFSPSSSTAPSDASQALSAALAELRRSLR